MQTRQPRCYIHIGAPKTGSTVIQRALYENREALEREGILYPDVSLRGYGHHDLAFLLAGGYPEWATPQPRSIEDLAASLTKLAGIHSGSLLISSEDFYLCPNPEGLHALLTRTGAIHDRPPVVIVYLRRQDDSHESWYNQTIKAQGYTHDVDTSVQAFHDLWDYNVQLDRWARVFGEDALAVRIFEEPRFRGGSLLSDFCEVIGFDENNFTLSQERVNTSLNKDLLEFQRIINSLPLNTSEKRRFHHQLMELTQRTRGTRLFDESPALSPGKRRAIMEAYQSSNAAVARRFFDQDELFAPSGGEDELQQGQGLTIEKLAAIVSWLLMGREGI